jgi:hypothetical protein
MSTEYLDRASPSPLRLRPLWSRLWRRAARRPAIAPDGLTEQMRRDLGLADGRAAPPRDVFRD